MQRGGRAARRLREFGDMDLDTTVQEVEAESKHTVDGDLPYPWDMQRDEDEPGCGKCAAGDHQMALAHMGDESRNRERIENTTHRERGDQQSRDRRPRLADGKKQQRYVREESMDEDCFEEYGCKADLGARVGKNAPEIGHHRLAIETRRRLRHHAAEGEERRDRHDQSERTENCEYAAPAEQVTDDARDGGAHEIAGEAHGKQPADRHLALIDRDEIA